MILLLFVLFGAGVVGSPPTRGVYDVAMTTHRNLSWLDPTDQQLVVVYPTGPKAHHKKFPLISYAHGAAGGGWYTFEGYFSLWTQMASYGFVIVATKSCTLGCKHGGWSTFFHEQLHCIDWARNVSGGGGGADPGAYPGISRVDWTAGVGICGHSMGGQATVRSATAANTAAHHRNITAAVLHHPEVDSGGGKIAVPLAAFTGTTDTICPAPETMEIWDPAPLPKTIRNQKGEGHLEPVLTPPIENPYLATFTAAWFKIYLGGDVGEYYDMIYNPGNASADALCTHAAMEDCRTLK